VTNSGSSSISVFINNGTGNVNPANGSPFAVGVSPGGVVLADFDEDGDLDLSTANFGSNTASVLINTATVYSVASNLDTVEGTPPGGVRELVFTVSRLSTSQAEDVTYTLGGTATGSDFTAPSGTVSFAVGQSTAEIHIAITSDTEVEPDETVTVTLTGVSGDGVIDPAAGSVTRTIVNDDTQVTFGFRLVDATVRYEGSNVIVDGPSSHTVVTGAERIVFADGTVDLADGNPLVDDLFYYSRNHDVWNAHIDAESHFNGIGWREGRDPDSFFSVSTYLSANPDVRAGGVNPLDHWHAIGWTEGRVPSVRFDPAAYLAANPDVDAANVDPLAHFLQFGADEGRLPFAPTSLVTANGFDYVYYLNNNPDVDASGADPFHHFMTVGWTEGRNPNALFDTNGYLAAYTDVAAAGVNPLEHYHAFGFHEGRDPSGGFDTASYLAAYPDVQAAGVDPLVHFLQFGIHEGRSPFADGVFA
jgi:hypothetical protein